MVLVARFRTISDQILHNVTFTLELKVQRFLAAFSLKSSKEKRWTLRI
jgi:hypothetical protein